MVLLNQSGSDSLICRTFIFSAYWTYLPTPMWYPLMISNQMCEGHNEVGGSLGGCSVDCLEDKVLKFLRLCF